MVEELGSVGMSERNAFPRGKVLRGTYPYKFQLIGQLGKPIGIIKKSGFPGITGKTRLFCGVDHAISRVRGLPPRMWKCRWGTVWPASGPQLLTTR